MMDAVCGLSREYDMLPSGETVLCAVSGGADSMCLLHLLVQLSPQWGFSLHCAHFNHHLRGAESDRDEAFVRAWCDKWNIPLTCGGADVLAESKERAAGIEETARSLRYAFLEETAKTVGASRIATAHTADDNAETLLLNLVRGSGLQGLGGIHPRRGNVVRPLLKVTRAQVEAYCAEQGVSYVEDSTNSDESYSRNFLRHQVIPLLRRINPKAPEHLSAAAEKVREDHEYLNRLARDVLPADHGEKGTPELKAEAVASLPEPVAARAVRLMIDRAGGGKNCTAAHVEAVLKICRGEDPSAQVDLPGLRVRREYERLLFEEPECRSLPPQPMNVSPDRVTVYGDTGWTVYCRYTLCPKQEKGETGRYYLSADRIKLPMELRPRREGDGIKLPGRGTKSLKKLFIEEKVPLSQRERIPVLTDAAGILAVGGFGADQSRLAAPGERALEILFEKERTV